MNRRLSVRLPEGLAWGIQAQAWRTGRTKAEIVREALTRVGVGVPSSTEIRREALRRFAEFRAQQTETVDAVALIRESREELDSRCQPDPPLRRRLACKGGRPASGSRVTAGFQQPPSG